jgi:hypothetical protein
MSNGCSATSNGCGVISNGNRWCAGGGPRRGAISPSTTVLHVWESGVISSIVLQEWYRGSEDSRRISINYSVTNV